MRKLIPYIALLPLVGFGLVPPVMFGVETPPPEISTWLILVSAFLGFYTLFIKANPFVKIIAIGSFFNCFYSHAPHLSFIAHMTTIACCYFYILCSRINDWKPVFHAVLAILTLNLVLILMQAAGHDSLLNFGLQQKMTYAGVVGNLMQLKSLLVICLAFIIAYTKPQFIKEYLKSIIVITAALSAAYIYGHNVLHTFPLIRGPVWLRTIEMALQHPVIGWGGGTYMGIFNGMNADFIKHIGQGLFSSPHNEFLHIAFEYGLIGLGVMLGGIYFVMRRKSAQVKLAISLVLVVMMFHFPLHQISTIPLLIAFFAFCEHGEKLKEEA